MTPRDPRAPGKVGIFRRVAVRNYSQPLVRDTPEMLTPRRTGLCLVAALLGLAAIGLWWGA